ncbi:MAG: flagellar basal body P-ring formation chaperone FlgA [candidate division Zixibacteria bacterium]|nr:flagellar basal body P-ring formation chaperone FlgA [candidate division Zixibacteria bacterium]
MDRLYKFFLIIIFLAFSVSYGGVIENRNQYITDCLFNEFNLDSEFYDIEILTYKIKTKNLSEFDLIISPLTPNEPIGLYSVLVKIYKGSKLIETSQIRTRIRKFANVVTSIDKISRNDEITNEMIDVKRMEVTTLREKAITNTENILGFRAERNIHKGQIITTGSVETFPDVERGEEVAIVYIEGAFKVSTVGKVLQEGRAGDYIKVKNKSSGKIVIARVVDGHSVAIDM